MEYSIRVPASLPDDGRVLVHNNVRPSRRMGEFRAWLEPMNYTVEPCRCGFVSMLGTHYRKRVQTRA